MYGLKQTPWAWFKCLSSFLHSIGFVIAKADTFLLFRHSNGETRYILVYVDDIIIIGSSSCMITQLISSLNAKFALKDPGQLSYFLGIEVSYPPSGTVCFSLNLNIFMA